MTEDLEYSMPSHVGNIAAALGALATVQEIVSGVVPGAIPERLGPVSKEQLRSYTLAMMVEIAEFVQTLDWKPWTPGEDVRCKEDKMRTADEFADILAFLGVLVVYLERLGIPPSHLAKAYAAKTKVNVQRLNGRFK